MTNWIPELPAAGDKPIYLAIVDALQDAIRKAVLPAGARLPAQRELAKALGVTVGTVSRAFIEAQRRGLIECGVGSGSYVRRASDALADAAIDLRTHAPAFPEGIDGRDMLEQALAGCLRGDALAGLLAPEVSAENPMHREAAVAWLARCGVTASSASVLIAAGAQNGLYAILATLSRPGAVVLCEAFTNPGFMLAARQLGLSLVEVASDGEGVLPDAVAQACRQHAPCVLYCQPTWANPTAATMSPARRKALAAVLERHDLPMIEDDDYGPLAPEGLPPLAALAPGQVFYLASLSKPIGFGLRLAYVQAPPRWQAALQSQLRATIWMVSPLVTELAASWQRQGLADRILRWRRDEAAARAQLARQHLGVPVNGMASHVWIALAPGWRGDRFVQGLERQGVLLAAGESFAVQPSARGYVRVTLGAVPRRASLARGLELVGAALRQPPEIELL
ncbi:PLP-dependent aminotransferase family protein [Massilia solisilvae]|uniref:PLP-dependent aminotransferase family protein n=1 Tax=Massilia solisilvae TaxID=1811225 RepID=A0ABT2BPQ1_9BURK|nr:PLP-dependent aminotransferase family protein [Massilia solisilvae]MCS0610480.1 PLP-dependent aminotransferase family protein [Massilia solisilvae]